MNLYVIDEKEQQTWINNITDSIHNHKYNTIFTNNINNITVMKYHYEYYQDVLDILPNVLTNIIIEYSHEKYDVKSSIKHTIDEIDTYTLHVTNEELNIDFELFMTYIHGIQIYNLIINHIQLNFHDNRYPNSQRLNGDVFINYYMQEKYSIIRYLPIDTECGDRPLIKSFFDKINILIDHEKFMNELVLIKLLYNAYNDNLRG